MHTETLDCYDSHTDQKMIEFKGTYFQQMKSNAMDVLVQYDGVLLHVWHLADPFYRLTSSDVFHVAGSGFKPHHVIRLPNGGRIETDNGQAVDLLQQHHEAGRKKWRVSTYHWLALLISAIVIYGVLVWFSTV